MISEQLITQARQGNRQAQRTLYERYAGIAMSTAVRYVGDRAEACDVVQDAFVHILTHLDRFEYRGEPSLRRWICRIVANESLYVLRRSKLVKMAVMPDDVAEESDVPPLAGISSDVLQQLLLRLPPGYRAVLNLYVFEECSHREIASLLGITESTSASQYLRAKRMLGKMIKDYRKQEEV